MNKIISAVAVLGLATSAFAGGLPEEMPVAPCAASDSGVYLGLGAGYGRTTWKNAEYLIAQINKSASANVKNDNHFAGRVFAGYDFNRFFAVEFGYTYLFTKTKIELVSEEGVGEGTIKHQVFDLVAKIKAPIMDSLDAYAKVGANYMMIKNREENCHNFNVTYGAGLDYAFTPNIIANVEWLRFNGNDDFTSGNFTPKADVFMLGVRYKFEL